MRQQTRRKYYGRTAVAQALRTASAELARAVEISEKPAADPLLDSLKKVATSVGRALEAEKVYILSRAARPPAMSGARQILRSMLHLRAVTYNLS